MTTNRWALAGFGSGGRIFHAPLIAAAPGLELAAVVTRDPVKREEISRLYPTAVCVDTLADLPALDIAGVTVTTPTATHADVATQALDLGLAVVVDKPFALDATRAAALVEHATAVGRPLTVYQNRRWDPDFLTVARLQREGRLGTVHRFVSRLDRSRPVKSGWHGASVPDGGGLLFDLGPHLVDQAVHLFGPVEAVSADLLTVRPGAGAEDDFVVQLRHRSGTHSTLAASLAAPAAGLRYQVNGSEAGFTCPGSDVQEDSLKAGHSPADLGLQWGVEPDQAAGTLVPTVGSAESIPLDRGRWDSYYPAVAAWLGGAGPAPVDPHDAIHTAEIIDAARISARTGRAVAPADRGTGRHSRADD